MRKEIRECFGRGFGSVDHGIKRGVTYGVTDELGFNTVEQRVHIHDLQATILNQLGLDHERLTFRYAGRDFRLTDVHGRVVNEILA